MAPVVAAQAETPALVREARQQVSIKPLGCWKAPLAEEKKTDETLTELAESDVNQHAQAA